MVITSQMLTCTYSGAFLETIDFLRAKKRCLRIQAVRITHCSAKDGNSTYSHRQVNSIIQLLSAIPETSLTRLECVYLKA
jgi:hypothetical protein